MKILEMSKKEFETKSEKLSSQYHKSSHSPMFISKDWRHDYYARNGVRMLTVFERR